MVTRTILVALVVLALGSASRAQEQHAAIEGVVRDIQGGVVPGVVVLTRSASGLAVESLTDDLGKYRFASLPANRYDLTATLTGFAPARITNVDLLLGVQLSVDIVLTPAGPDETVVVVSSAPLVAVTQSSRAVSIRGDAIEKMPRGRDFTSLALQAPGANNESKLAGVSIDGSSGAENRVVIDGIETTDTWVGTPGQFLVTDFVEELQVKSSGYAAEYGGSTGGVLNAITKSGTNTWRGDALFYWSGDALDAAPRPTLQIAPTDIGRAEYVTYPKDRYLQLEAGFTLGGPILRDHLWFFGGYVPSFRPLDRTVTFRADGSTSTYRQDLTRHNAAVNVLAQPGVQTRVRAAFNTGSQRQDGLLPTLDGTSNPGADYSIDEVTPNYSTSVTVDFTPSSRVLLSARTGYFFRDFYNEGVYRGDRVQYVTSSVGMPGVPPVYQQPRGYTNVPSNIGRDKGNGPHFSFQLDGTAVVSGLGQHQLKAGLQFDRVGVDALAGGTGNGIAIFWDQSFMGARGPFGYYRLGSNDRQPNLGFITQGKATVDNVGLFFQDSWTLGRFTIQAGLRTENEAVPSLSPDPQVPMTAIRFGFDDKLAPRLGLAWDVTGDGKTKVYGSWGVFYDITKLQLSFGFGGVSSVGYSYTLDSADIAAIIDNQDCPPACPGRLIARSETGVLLNDPNDSHIDPGLDQTRLQEAVAGVEREIAPNLSVGVRYIHKQIDRAVEDVGTRDAGQLGTTIRIANPGFGQASSFYPERSTTPMAFPKARRDYDAVEAALDRRLSRGWSTRVSYTWSRLAGNYSGLAQSDEDGRVAPNIGRNFDYPMMAFDERGNPVYGVLATDRPHQLKANAVLDTRYGASIGARWFGASGTPKTREAAFMPLDQIPVMYRGRNSDSRLPFLTQLDVYALQQIPLGSRTRMSVGLNVINVLNQKAVTNYFPTELFPGQAIAVDESTFYNGVDTQALITAQHLVRDPRFLMDSGFQPARTLRLEAKMSF
jgi:hypothetical protein